MESVPALPSESERRPSRRELDAVVARALQLQLRDEADGSDEQLSEADVLRIGHELGLCAQHLRQALAQVDGGRVGEATCLARHVGVGRAAASRTIAPSADAALHEIDVYLRETDCMVVDRRLPTVTVYGRASGVVASATRAVRRLADRHPLLGARRVDVAVQPSDGASCFVAVAVDGSRKRRDAAQAAAVGGGALGGAAAVLAGTVLAPPAGLVGLPFALAAAAASRDVYGGALAETAARAKSLLDRLGHRDLVRPPVRRLSVLGS